MKLLLYGKLCLSSGLQIVTVRTILCFFFSSVCMYVSPYCICLGKALVTLRTFFFFFFFNCMFYQLLRVQLHSCSSTVLG